MNVVPEIKVHRVRRYTKYRGWYEAYVTGFPFPDYENLNETLEMLNQHLRENPLPGLLIYL